MNRALRKNHHDSLIRRAMRISVAEGAFASVHISLTGGAFLTGYALMLGAGNISPPNSSNSPRPTSPSAPTK
jgi:hypothetical protein